MKNNALTLHCTSEKRIAYVLDARQVDEYEKAHLPGSICCPAGEVVLNAERIIGVRNAAIVTFQIEEHGQFSLPLR